MESVSVGLDRPESLDMSGMNHEQRLASVEAKAENHKTSIGEIKTSIGTIEKAISQIQTDLTWHRNTGWGIAGLFMVVFGWLITFYLPSQFSDKLPANFKEDWGAMKQNIAQIQDTLRRLTPGSIDKLLSPPTGTAPTSLRANLQQASQIIDVALATQIPGDPSYLSSLRYRVGKIADQYRNSPEIRERATGAEVRLDAYARASRRLLEGRQPELAAPKRDASLSDYSYFMNFTADCTYPTVQFMVVNPESARQETVIFNVLLKTCAQDIHGIRWVNDTFTGATLEYNGGPLYLADTSFLNCKFKFGNDPQSKMALAAIRASHGKPVNLLIPD